MEFKRSEKLEKFLDNEILRFENEEDIEQEKEKSEDSEYENIIAEEIAKFESRFDTLDEDDKEYLEWLKN